MSRIKKQHYKKIALALCLCAIILWGALGTGTSLAWFMDTDEEVKNIFNFGEFELKVSHRLDNGEWEEVESQTELFDDEALYEPGYVQVVYLKVENVGTLPFEFQSAVNVTGYTVSTNVFGQSFNLQDHLKFGVATATTEAGMDAAVENRQLAKELATMNLGRYSTEVATLQPEETSYLALIVRMPEEVNNIANYRGSTIPRVELGVVVSAVQIAD